MGERVQGRQRWIKAALIASVTLNLLVAGVVAGGMLGRDRFDGRAPQAGDMLLGPLGAAFSRQDRAEMRQGAERIGVDLGTMRNSLRTDVETLISLVEADPWNPDAVQAHLTQMRARGDQRARLGEQVMLQRLGAMSAQERHDYAARLRLKMAHFERHRRDDGGAE